MLLASTTALADDCLSKLSRGWDSLDFAAKRARIDHLGGRGIRCVFDATAATPPPGPGFFAQEDGRVHPFYGRNGFVAFSRFVKAFFVLGNETYGYNDSFIGRLTGSAGFFLLKQEDAGLIFDYRDDFDSLIPARELAGLRGARWKKPHDNGGNVLFGNLTDVMHGVNADVVVGESLRMLSSGPRPEAYFILLREPR